VLSLEQALAALPGTADDIAAHLAAKGIRGAREDSCNCPMVVYLTSLDFDRVNVTLSRILARAQPGGALVDVRTPWWIAEFVHRFDEGEWPELVAELPDDETTTEEQTA
jgi:hypothetical protein